jgi:methylmalonyl-CoA/ethylmalonyl-CoA epimerase
MITGIDHLGTAIADRSRAINFFEGVLGCPVYARGTDPTSGLKNGLIRVGKTDFVIQQPPKPGIDPEANKDYIPPRDPAELRQVQQGLHLDTAVFVKYLQKWGEGIHHLGIRVPDLLGAWRALKEAGLPLLDDLEAGERPGIRDSQLFFPNPKDTFGVLLQFTARPESDGFVWDDAKGGWKDSLAGGEPPISQHYNGIDHIGIIVDDAAAAGRFYNDVLKLKLLGKGKETNSDGNWSIVEIGESAIMFREFGHKFSAGHPLSKFRPRRGKGIHYVALDCKDVAVTGERLSAAGAKIVPNDTRENDREPKFFIDPAGTPGILFGFNG